MDLIRPQDLLSASKSLKYFGGLPLAKLLMHVLQINALNKGYSPYSHLKNIEFVDAIIGELDATFNIPPEDLEKIPKEGPFITISNHPYGGLDGLMWLKTLVPVREDIKVLVNFLLTKVEPVNDYFLAVNPFETHKDVKSSLSGLKEAFLHLKKGHPLGIFPAGEVATYQFDKGYITDRQWQTSVIKFIKKANVPVIPVYFDGHNGWLFHLMGFVHPLLRTVKLPSELVNKRGHHVEIRIGNPISVKDQSAFSDIHEYSKFLRQHTYSLALSNRLNKRYAKPQKQEPIIEAVPFDELETEIESIRETNHLFTIKDFAVFSAPSEHIPMIMREIGRLREITFREVGEATNKSVDIDNYDPHYEQLFIWDNKAGKIVGGYRVGKGKTLINEQGSRSFYLNSLFKLSAAFQPFLSQSIELGRSFIVKEYQRKPISLFLLWKGILYFLLKNPEYRYLIGPVSISNMFSDQAKSLMVEYIKANHFNYEYATYIKARKPFKYKIDKRIDRTTFIRETRGNICKLENFIQDFEPGFKVPVLLKKYFSLNAEIIGFNVDPDFNNCLDGFLIQDLFDVPMKTIESLSKEINDQTILERFKK